MNRICLMVLASNLMLGGLGLMASSAHAQAPSIAAPASTPRYYYGWGSNGWGYYYYTAAPSVPLYRGGYFSSPAPSWAPTSSPAPSAYREPGTGRSVNLAKPWLQPLR